MPNALHYHLTHLSISLLDLDIPQHAQAGCRLRERCDTGALSQTTKFTEMTAQSVWPMPFTLSSFYAALGDICMCSETALSLVGLLTS